MKDTDTKKYKSDIVSHGFTEYELTILIKARCGGEYSGWVSNAVEYIIRRVLPREGIMVDEVSIRWPLIEVPREDD